MRLGITKREWTLVLGANLAILLAAYAIALACTLSGSDFFLLNVHSEALESLEATLRGWNLNFAIGLAFATIEETIILSFVVFKRPRLWWVLAYVGIFLAIYLPIDLTGNKLPSWITLAIGCSYALVLALIYGLRKPKEAWKPLVRLGAAFILSFVLNNLISMLRTNLVGIGLIKQGSLFFYLNFEYDLALGLALGFLALLITREKGEKKCKTSLDAGGSSMTSTNNSPKRAKNTNNKLPPKLQKRLRRIKAVTFATQFAAIIAISIFPAIIGKGTEYALMYVSFCATRIILGFRKSLHFKSEALCITTGALVFWGLTVLIPSTEAIIITSVAYGCGLALGFRLWWELHDLRLFRKATKRDRYAMLYCAFKGNPSPKHIKGIMRLRGYDDLDIRIITSYMQGLKVEAIAYDEGFARITVEKRLTEISSDLYARR